MKVLKNKTVQMVSYNELQKLFAILTDHVLGFITYQMGGRMQITNKRCDIAWWDRKMKFKAMMIDEIDKNIFGSCDSAKEFKV